MTNQTIAQLTQRLGCDEQQLAFLEFLPEAAQTELNEGITKRLDQQSSQLSEAIASGTAALPGWLKFFANILLK